MRDSRLMEAREATFGGLVEGLATCDRCRTRLEVSLQLSDLRDAWAEEETRLEIAVGDPPYRVRFRLPDTRDLAAAAGEDDFEAARRMVAARCVLHAERDGRPVPATALPDEALAQMERAMAEADPQAVVEIGMECPECGHRWTAPFDIADFFWEEVEGRARVLLTEIHTLALAYGWSEADVLAMPESRRHAYLDLVTG